MATYVPKTILLPNGLDEMGLKRSITRLPEERLGSFKRRILLEHRDPQDNSFMQFKKSPCRQLGELEKAVCRVNIIDSDITNPRLLVTSSKFYFWLDATTDPDIELELTNRDNGYFLEDIIDALNALTEIDVEILDSNYQYRKSLQLRVDDSSKSATDLLLESYENRLTYGYVSDYKFSDPLVFMTEKANPEDVTVSGDFYVDDINGVVLSYDLQHGYATYTYSDFPYLLWWQPVRVFELNDPDVDFLIKDTLQADSGEEHRLLNSLGTRYVNELLLQHPLEWGD